MARKSTHQCEAGCAPCLDDRPHRKVPGQQMRERNRLATTSSLVCAAWVLGLLVVDALPCLGESLTPSEVNLITLEEASISNVATVVEFFGPDPGVSLPFSGTFSPSGWTWDLSGVYLGQALTLSSQGTFDAIAGVGSWTSMGSLGTRSWASSGSVSNIQIIDPLQSTLDFSEVGAGVIDFIPLYDRNTKTKTKRNPDSPFVVDTTETTQYSLNGVPLGNPVENQDMIAPPNFQKEKTVAPPHDGVLVVLHGTMTDGQVTGTVTLVPEPSSLVLSGLGGLGLLAYTWYRRRGAAV
jgi:hypothetical protein